MKNRINYLAFLVFLPIAFMIRWEQVPADPWPIVVLLISFMLTLYPYPVTDYLSNLID